MLALIIVIAITIAAAVTFIAAMFQVVKSIRAPVQVAVVTPDSARKHRALIYLIRGMQFLVLVPMLALFVIIGLAAFAAFNPFRSQPPYSEGYSIMMFIALMLIPSVIAYNAIERYRESGWRGVLRNFRNLLEVNTNSISNFAFLFAILAAYDVYHLMQPMTPQFRHDHPGWSGLFLDRDFLNFVVFFGLWHLVKAIAGRILELGPKFPPKDLPPPWQAGHPRTF